MPLTEYVFTDALRSLGAAQIFVGDPFVALGLLNLGAVEGDMSVAENWTFNDLTAEVTGGAVHDRRGTLDSVVISGSLVAGDPAAFAKISPAGSGVGGGWSKPQMVQEFSVVLVPEDYLPLALNHTTGAWTRGSLGAGTPDQMVTIWRATPSHGTEPRRRANGGKVMIDFSFTSMFEAARAEGHKIYTRGDPIVNGAGAGVTAATLVGFPA